MKSLLVGVLAAPLSSPGTAEVRVYETPCEQLDSEAVVAAFHGLSAELADGVAFTDAKNVIILTTALNVEARKHAEDDQVFLVNFWHCERGTRGGFRFETCSGRENLLNTGLDNYHPNDDIWTMSRLHDIESFHGGTTAWPPNSQGRESVAPRHQSHLQCTTIKM